MSIITVFLLLALSVVIHDGFVCSDKTIEKVKNLICVVVEALIYLELIRRLMGYAFVKLVLIP